MNENRAFAPAVRLFSMLSDVHADSLLFRARAQRRDQCYRFENYERSHNAIENRSSYCYELDTELPHIAEQRAIHGAVPDFLR
jgi:hypothetical protein